LYVLVDRGLSGRDEAGAHVDGTRAECERCGETAAGCDPPACYDGDIERLNGGRVKDEAGDVVLAWMSSALEAGSTDGGDPVPRGGDCVAHTSRLVNHFDTCGVEVWHVRRGARTCSFNDGDPRLNNGGAIVVVRDGVDCGKNGQVHTEWSVGHF